MRTAVCLSGQPREVAEIWPTFVNNLLAHLPNPDVFIHTSQPYPVPQEYWDFVRPKAYVIEQQQPFPEMEELLARIGYCSPEHRNSYLQDIHGQRRVWTLKRQYEFDHGFRYDLAVRCRPDLLFLRPITLDLLELDKINHLADPDLANMPNEFAIGPDEQMAHYLTIFDWLRAEGEKHLLPTNGRLQHDPKGCYSPERISAVCLIDTLGLRLGRAKLPPEIARVHPRHTKAFYYRIMYRQKLGCYESDLEYEEKIGHEAALYRRTT